MQKIQKIIPNLWFDSQAEGAAKFYTSLFKNSAIGGKSYYGKAGQEFHAMKEGSLMTVEFELEKFQLIAMNAGPVFKFNPSISLFVICKSKEEAQYLWGKLIDGGEEMMPLDSYNWSPQYGWLRDRFGLSWQIMFEEPSTTAEKILPLLFFTGKNQGRAEEAIRFYTSLFKNSTLEGIQKYGDENPFAKGQVMHAQFQLEGQSFMAMDSAMQNDYPFNEAFSLMIMCEGQEEIDYYWDKLGQAGDPQAQQCGWLKDQFGLSWQVVPRELMSMMQNSDQKKVERVTNSFMQMKKMNLQQLRNAFEN